jgi:hypothetical protein
MKIKRYESVSLVEMLLTMVILSFVMILSGVVLTTMITTSAISKSRTLVRADTEFILEIIRRNIRNSQPYDIRLYNISGRQFNNESNSVEILTQDSLEGYEIPILPGDLGNELHFRPVGSQEWVCVGYVPSETEGFGYIIKSHVTDLQDPADCFNSPTSFQNILALNSEQTGVQYLRVSYFDGLDGNVIYTIESRMIPLYWLGDKMGVQPEYIKQIVTSTQKLTWNN